MDRFPISFWEYCHISKVDMSFVADWHDAGMTLAMGPSFSLVPEEIVKMRAILDACHERGLMAIINPTQGGPGRPEAPWEEQYREHVSRVLEAFGDHPAVFGPHLGDEPRREHFERACASMRIWREMAPRWQPFLNLLPWHFTLLDSVGYDRWGTYLDDYCRHARPPFISYDCYYQMNPEQMGDEIYFTNLKEYSSAAKRGGTVFWTTLLCTPHFEYRMPTEDEFRWQLNTALAWGARGILWFVFSMRGSDYQNYRVAPVNELGERTETYTWLSRVNRVFLNTRAPVMNRLELKRAYNVHFNYAWAGYPVCEEGWRVRCVTSECPIIVSEFSDPDGNDYVGITNMSRERNTHPTFAVAGRRPMLYRVGWGGAEAPVEQGAGGAHVRSRGSDYIAVHQYLAPGQMELYRVADEK